MRPIITAKVAWGGCKIPSPPRQPALEVLGASSEAAFGRASSMTVGKVKIPFTLYKTYGTEL